MIDLQESRALAEAARADTSDGLTARERLADVVEELCALLGERRLTYAVRATVTWDGKEHEVYHRYEDLRDARGHVTWRGPGAVLVAQQVCRGLWVEVPAEAQAGDE